MLGQMLFNGDRLPPQRARGLMWLRLASENAGACDHIDTPVINDPPLPPSVWPEPMVMPSFAYRKS
jgi:hypothetical protein